MNKIGFTLAEVLITLAIIGVVAALSIPSLITQTNDKELIVQLKKAYATISQATMQLQVQQGYIDIGTADTVAASNTLRDQYETVFKFIKKESSGNIFGPTNYKYYKGNNIGWPGTEPYASAILADGSFIRFHSYDNCTSNGINTCGDIAIDINGSKGPNMVGKDFHYFWISKNNGNYTIKPLGTSGDTFAPLPAGCTAGSTAWATSDGCTALMLTNPDSMP